MIVDAADVSPSRNVDLEKGLFRFCGPIERRLSWLLLFFSTLQENFLWSQLISRELI